MSTIPTSIGKYQIIREIARSNDIVYEAYDPLMNRRVALKELAMPASATEAQRADRVKRFLREAKAAGSLAHPNIVTIYEFGEDGDRDFLAMEFLDGHTLRNEVDTHGFLPADKAIEVAEAVLKGLDYAHNHGVIHRDIKPDNIQLLSDGRIKLTDFGIARLTFEPNITIDGQIFGTPSYMSPEQVVGKEIDARSDLFSVGVVLYEMLSGRKPFPGDSVVSISYAIMNKEPERLDQISWSLWQFLEKALDKVPGQRFSSATEMLAALQQAATASQHLVQDLAPPLPVGNPYQTPPPVIQPSYNYNPFQPHSQQPQVQIVPGPGGQPTITVGGLQVPMYYPRPPRGPLMKPETKVFISRLCVTLIVLGTLFGLVIIGVNAMSTALGRYQLQEQDRAKRERFVREDTGQSLEKRIADYEIFISNLQSKEGRAEERKNIAALYEKLGKRYLSMGMHPEAESAFLKSAENDPDNPAYASDLANLYTLFAEKSRGEQKIVMLDASATQWQRAAEHETNNTKRQSYASGAAVSLFNYASVVADSDPRLAREKLYQARDLALPSSQIAVEIQHLIDQLTRR